MSVPSRSPSAGRDEFAAAIDRHVAATTNTLARALVTTLATLDEPTAPDPDLALHRLSYLVEALLGVAAGAVIGSVVTAVIGGAGRDLAPAVQQQLRAALAQIGPARRPGLGALTPSLAAFVTDAAARPLVDELGARLHPRLASASRDHHQVLQRCAAAIPDDRAASFTAALAQLDADTMLEHLWTEHLRVGWYHFTAAVAHHRVEPTLPADLATAPAVKTWRTWLRRVRGERDEAVATPRADYIMAVG